MVVRILLVALYAWWISSTLTFNLRFFAFMRPLVSGLIVGIILGEPVTGTIIGASINAVYLGWVSIGGVNPGDIVLAGVLGPALGILAGMSTEAALALAVPIASLGSGIATLRMALYSFLVHSADKAAEKGDIAGVVWVNIIPNVVFSLIYPGVIVFVALYWGVDPLVKLLNALPDQVLAAINTAGLLLPALGFALLLRYLASGLKQLAPFLIGFILVTFMNVSIIGVVVLAICYLAISNYADKAVTGEAS